MSTETMGKRPTEKGDTSSKGGAGGGSGREKEEQSDPVGR